MHVTKQRMVSTLQWLIIGEPIIAKNGLQVRALMVIYWKAHKPVYFVHSYVLSVTQQYKHRTT